MTKRSTTLAVAITLALATGVLAQPTLEWTPADTLLSIGDPLTLSVMLPEALDVRTVELRVDFDPEVIESIDGEPGALFDGLTLFEDFSNTASGAWYGYCVVLGADDWATGPGELYRWHVAAVDTGVALLETASLTLLPPGNGDYPDAELDLGRVWVDVTVGTPEVASPAASLRLYPNPFNPRTRLELSLPAGRWGKVAVLDLGGRVVAPLWAGAAPADAPVILDWDGRDQAGDPVPSGLYLFVVEDEDQHRLTQKGLLLR
jgi:hypothetical protein